MTLFAMLALFGAAGLALSLKPRPAAVKDAGAGAAQPAPAAQDVPAVRPAPAVTARPAEAVPGFAGELKEAEDRTAELALRLERLEANMARIEAGRAALAAEKKASRTDRASRAARAICAAAENSVASRKKPAARRVRRAARPAPEAVPALSDRLGAVVAAYGRNGDMMETARELNMGLAEVQLALKVNELLPSRG